MFRARRGTLLAIAAGVLAVVGSAEVASAQRALPLASVQPGDTVRVWTHGPPLRRSVAVVMSVATHVLVVTDVPGRPARLGVVNVPVEALTRLQVQRGIRPSNEDFVVGFTLGTVCGAVVGAFVGGFLCDECQWFGGAIAGAIPGAVAGALTGALLGSRPRPRWRSVALAPSP